ncbi:MAG TPA: 5'/3'-nucleotidase SurE [Planctomycetes bacterium]|nr:5'/3'-nucleotidase SurE [Planctomycetota bacterium]
MTHILLANDDGADAPGLIAAYEALCELGEVTVVAPAQQQSGQAHAITLETPLRANRLRERPGYRVPGTPVDCVKLALNQLVESPPELVVSGINQGTNGGILVHYSGTVAAAKEACLQGIPAMAVSLCQYRDCDYSAAARVTRTLAERLLAQPLPRGVLLNVNVPPGPYEALAGLRWCRQSLASLDDVYERREDPRGRPYYWLGGSGPFKGEAEHDDLIAVEGGYVALTPLRVDWTDEESWRGGGSALVEPL